MSGFFSGTGMRGRGGSGMVIAIGGAFAVTGCAGCSVTVTVTGRILARNRLSRKSLRVKSCVEQSGQNPKALPFLSSLTSIASKPHVGQLICPITFFFSMYPQSMVDDR